MSRSRLTEITMKYIALVMMIGLLGACGAKSDDTNTMDGTTDSTTDSTDGGAADTTVSNESSVSTKEAPAPKDTPAAAEMRTVELDISGMT
jgi:hypothetical protein